MEPNEAMKAMQINDDPLIEVIARAESEFYREPLNSFASLPAALAAAVRSFMGSPAVVEKLCEAQAGFHGFGWPDDYDSHQREMIRGAARAGLAAIGGQNEGA